MEHPRIELAHEPDFPVGALTVHPSTRELSRGYKRLVIEPRVMQVLVALHRAGGAVISKDDLAQSCWEGRIVGEDAINRVLSRLRKVSEGIGKDVFRIETVTRVGYRMIASGADGTSADGWKASTNRSRRGVDRRVLVAGMTVTAIGATTAWLVNRSPPVPDRLAKLIDKAESAMDYSTPEQNEAAVAILQEAARLYPKRAEVWGKLALAYRQVALGRRRSDARSLLNRTQAAARRAVEMDPGNVDGSVIIAAGNGLWYESYLEYDHRTKNVLARFPDHLVARRARAGFLFETGQIRESIQVGASLVDASLPSPAVTSHAIKLWSAGRLDEADYLLRTLAERWPRHFSVWVSRYKFLLFSGRLGEAETMLGQVPVGLEDIDFKILAAQTEAIRNPNSESIETALHLFDGVASTIMSKTQEAASFSSAVARLDTAFAYLDQCYFFGKPIRSFRSIYSTSRQLPHSGVMTFFLFEPPMRAVRADPRFAALTERLGLQDYWSKANIKPDYMSALSKLH